MKRIGILLIIFVFTLSASGCFKDDEKAHSDKLTVYASFYPMYDFAVKIGGEKAEVKNMVPAGAEPHDWEPKSSDIAKLEKADLFIYSGAGMEPWVDNVIGSVKPGSVLVVMASKDLSPAPDIGKAADPHLWLNIANAIRQLRNIRDAYIEADPDNADYYLKNYEKYSASFDLLHTQYRQEISSFSNKTIITAHEAYGHMCGKYGLVQMSIEGLTPDSEPTPERMAEIIDFIKENDVKAIFYDGISSSDTVDAIVRETGVKLSILSPLEALSEEQEKSNADYVLIMKRNLSALRNALR